MNINQIVTLFKTNKTLLVPVVALLVVFLYNIVGDFFSTGVGKSNSTGGTIQIEKPFVSEKEAKDNNYKTTEDEKQLGLIAKEEKDVKDAADKDPDKSYMRKEIYSKDSNSSIKIGNVERPTFGTEIKDGKKETLADNCRNDIVTGLTICKEKDGKQCIEKDGKTICLDEKVCKKFPYNTLEECKAFLAKKDDKKVELYSQESRDVNSRGVKSSRGSKQQKESFGVNPQSKEYQKYAMMLNLVNVEPEEVQGFIGQNVSVNNQNENSDENLIAQVEEEIVIRPGSSYLGQLMNPLNSLYKDDIHPIVDIVDGDLAGYRMVGKISFSSPASGIIIKAKELIAPDGKRIDINAIALRFEGDELTPLFADEINWNLGGKIGFGFLAAITNDIGGMMTTNNSKDDAEVGLGETSASEGSGEMADTFKKISESYKPEVKVNPQTMIIMFY